MEKPAYVLVHGAWHDASCWQTLVPILKSQGFECHAPDLPSHGKNTAEAGKTTLKVYSNYISQYIDNIDKKVILVGHSMAGMVISQVAEEKADRLERLVYLSAYLPENGQSLFSLIAANRDNAGEAPIEKLMSVSTETATCSIPDQSIQELFYNCSPQAMIPTFFPEQAALPFSGKVRLSEEGFGHVQKTYICCLEDHVIPISHQRYMLKRQACDEMVQLDSDHSPFVSCPELLGAILCSVSLST